MKKTTTQKAYSIFKRNRWLFTSMQLKIGYEPVWCVVFRPHNPDITTREKAEAAANALDRLVRRRAKK